MRRWGLVLLALMFSGCAFGMAQFTPEQLEALAKNREASVVCFDGTYAGAKIKMLFVNADRGVPAGVQIKDSCDAAFMSGQK